MARLGEVAKVDACALLLADADFEIRRCGAPALVRIGTPAALLTLERVAADNATPAAAKPRTPQRSSGAPPPPPGLVTFE